MRRVTVSDRISAYLKENPGSQIKEIARSLDITSSHAANTLRRMGKKGLVTSKPFNEKRQSYKRRYYLARAESKALAIAAQGQAYKSPFGVVMAQLMR